MPRYIRPHADVAPGLGALIRAYRQQRRMPQRELAKLIDVSLSSLSRIETGGTTRPSNGLLMKIGQVLNIPLPRLIPTSSALHPEQTAQRMVPRSLSPQAADLLHSFGTRLAVAEALLRGELNAEQEACLEELLNPFIMEAVQFRVGRSLQQR